MEYFESNHYLPRNSHVDMIIIYSLGEYMKNIYAPEYLDRMGFSRHYYIKPSGKIVHSVEPDSMALHSGSSTFKGKEYLNNNSVSITLLLEGNYTWTTLKTAIDKNESFTDKHYENLEYICRSLMKTYPLIFLNNIVRYEDVLTNDKNTRNIVGNGFNFKYFKNRMESFIFNIDNELTKDKEQNRFKDILSFLF